MATRSISASHTQLHHIVTLWENRRRQQQILRWLPRALAIASLLAIGVTLIMRFGVGLQLKIIASIALLVVAAGAATVFTWIWFAARSSIGSARYFDIQFGLQERLSTALELAHGQITSSPELVDAQLQDALQLAHKVDHHNALPLKFYRRDWFLAILLLPALLLSLFLPAGAPSADQNSTTQQAGVMKEAAGDLRDIAEEIATNTAIRAEDRRELLETLEISLEKLEDGNTSAEEAFAMLNNAASRLRDQAQELTRNQQTLQAGLEAAAEALQNRLNAEGSSGASEIPTLSEILDQLQNALADATENGEIPQATDALEDAADALADTTEPLVDSLREAAEALRQEDMRAAQPLLQQAQRELDDLRREQQQQGQTAGDLQEAAEQTEQGAQEIAEANRQPGEGEQAQGRPSDSDGNAASDSRQGQSENARQQSNQGQPVDAQNADPQTASQSQQNQSGNSASRDAGSSSSQQESDPFASSFISESQNNAEEAGARAFQSIYAPQRIGGQGDQNITLETEAGDDLLIERDLAENPVGESQVPYNRVFPQYQDAANRALGNQTIPLSLRDVARDYFSSLQPPE